MVRALFDRSGLWILPAASLRTVRYLTVQYIQSYSTVLPVNSDLLLQYSTVVHLLSLLLPVQYSADGGRGDGSSFVILGLMVCIGNFMNRERDQLHLLCCTVLYMYRMYHT